MESQEQTEKQLPPHILNATKCAEELSIKLEGAWVDSISETDKLLGGILGNKKLTTEQDSEVRDAFAILCEYLMGTSVALMSHYINDSHVFEKYIQEMVSDKFNRIRTMKRIENGTKSSQ